MGLEHAAQSVAQTIPPEDVLVETVVVVVVAEASHAVMVVHAVVVIVSTVELTVAPEKNDVEREIVSVHRGTAVLAVHDDDARVEDASDWDGELVGFFSAFCRS